ncbi:MAG: uroporphyrinogen decarboxylase family protein [Ignisphaera sp.]
MDPINLASINIKEFRIMYKDSFLKAVKFDYPKFIPCRISLPEAMFYIHREKLIDVIKRYPHAFPDYEPSSIRVSETPLELFEDRYVKDVFGTVWRYKVRGLGPQPSSYPLDDLNKVKDWVLPDPEEGYPIGYADPKPMIYWEELFNRFDKLKEQGRLVVFSLHHFLFQKLMDVIPLNKLIYSIYKGDERLLLALEKIAEYQYGLLKVAKRYRGIDVVTFLEDLGSQNSPLIKPEHLRKYFLPYYRKFSKEVKGMGAIAYFHSDGMIVPLIDVILEAEVDVLNIQDVVNNVDNIATKLKGRVCVDLDIDRQKLIPYGTKEEIHNYIRNVIEKLSTERGGLIIHIEVYPPTPIENIEYLAQACYRYCLKREL